MNSIPNRPLKKFTGNLLRGWRAGSRKSPLQRQFNQVIDAALQDTALRVATFPDLVFRHQQAHADKEGNLTCDDTCVYRHQVNIALKDILALGVDKDQLIELSELVADDSVRILRLAELKKPA